MHEAIDAYSELARLDYTAYTHFVHQGAWKVTRFGRYLTERVQDFLNNETGHPYDILILSCPPQHGKSLTITETLPSFYLGRNPDKRVIEVSYSEEFAKKFGRRNKQKLSQFGQYLFDVKLADSPNSATEFEITGHRGGMISRGVGSALTGNPADLIIIDDPIKNSQEAYSETYRENLWENWLTAIRSRLSAGAKVILIMTRWHEDDLAGRMIEHEPNVTVINIPCEAEENDLLGRDVGEALCPEIGKGDEWLEQFKAGFLTKEGSRAWNSLYQGRPTATEGNLIKREWWKFYDVLPADIPVWCLSVDATFKEKDDSDFVSITLWGKEGNSIYLIDEIHEHLDFTGTISAIENMRVRYPKISMVLIEDKANGSAIISVLRRYMLGIIAIEPIGGKVSRANAVTPAIEAGNVYLPRYAPFTQDFITECAVFPNGKYDDRVDSMSQALSRLIFFKADVRKEDPKEGWVNRVIQNRNKKKNPLGVGEKIDVM